MADAHAQNTDALEDDGFTDIFAEGSDFDDAMVEEKAAASRKDRALRMLDAWIATETLSPRSFKNFEEMVPDREDARHVSIGKKTDDGSFVLPWQDGYPYYADTDRYQGFLGHQVILGTINIGVAMQRLTELYGQDIERRIPEGISPIATVQIDEKGRVVENSLNITSFAWALPRLLNDDLESLSSWPDIERAFKRQFQETVAQPYTADRYGAGDAVGPAGIRDFHTWISEKLGLAPFRGEKPNPEADLFALPRYVISYYKRKPFKKWDPKTQEDKWIQPRQKDIEPLFMNSFFLEDLSQARRAVQAGEQPEALSRYLGVTLVEKERIDLIHDRDALRDLVSPAQSGAGRWPVPGHHPLVVLQQAAVNAACSEDPDTRICAINGPPGTGKTTLLKDMAANSVVARARAMVEFTSPDLAFKAVGGSWPVIRQGRAVMSHHGLAELHPSITGHEILVASSNNAAVENVSAEWPDAAAIDEDTGLEYFPQTGQQMHERACWGAFAASLGNRSKRAKFVNRFWFQDDYGLKNHFNVIQGRPVLKFEKGKQIRYTPKLVEEHKPPRNPREAQQRWEQERQAFLTLYKTWEQVQQAASARYAESADTHFDLDHEPLQKSAPTFTKEENAVREKLFAQAMRVHKAFIEAAPRVMESNLNAAMSLLNGSKPDNPRLAQAAMQSLFLVTPVISTTFASVHNMLAGLPNESIGHLVVDEAGQASPQAAIGALMKARRAVVVGDPVQIEPVVTLPSNLSRKIATSYNVGSDETLSQKASVQTFADKAGRFMSVFPSANGDRVAGLPLLVQRRYGRLVHDIANEAGYGGLMVCGTPARDMSPVEKTLGPPAWYDVVDEKPETKWSPKEGEVVLDHLKTMASRNQPISSMFLVTPFRDVASGLRRLVRQNAEDLGLKKEEDIVAFIRSNIGTVHTVQGRESDAVMLVLGAQGPRHRGARNWAGETVNNMIVAVTRSQRWVGVVGNRENWSNAGCYRILEGALTPPFSPANDSEPEVAPPRRQARPA